MALAKSDNVRAESPRPDSVEAIFESLESPLLNYAMRLLRELPLAEDIVQEAFMRLHEQFAEVRDPRRWLYRTVHNLALNQLRATRKIVPLVHEGEQTQVAADAAPLPDEAIIRCENIGQVRLCLDALDERSRELIVLKFTEGLSYKEISQRTGLTAGHVGYLLHHALKTIASELARKGVVS